MNTFGAEGVARFQRLCAEALADTELVTKHADRSPRTDPKVGDVLAWRSTHAQRREKLRVVLGLTEDKGEAMVRYGSDPWTNELEPKGRKTKLKTWAKWCNDRHVHVVRYAFQPLPCRMVYSRAKAPRISCRNLSQLGELVVAAFEGSALAKVDPGHRVDPYRRGVELLGDNCTGRCSACEKAEGEGAPLLPPSPEQARGVLRARLAELLRWQWNSPHTFSRITEADPHTAEEALDILIAAIATAEHPEGWECLV
jgi:hypothetical protein